MSYLQPLSTIQPFQRAFPVKVLLQIVRNLSRKDLAHVCETSLEFASAFLSLLYDDIQARHLHRYTHATRIKVDGLFCSRVSPSRPI